MLGFGYKRKHKSKMRFLPTGGKMKASEASDLSTGYPQGADYTTKPEKRQEKI